MDITYRINRSRKRRKTISLQVNDNAELVVAAPCFTPEKDIARFVLEKQKWIHQNLQKQKKANVKKVRRQFADGEHYYYLGYPYPLNVFFDPFTTEGITLKNDRFHLNTQGNTDVRRHYLVSWYKQKAQSFIRQRVDFFGEMLKLTYGNISVTSARKRWGSCSAVNDLAFSFRLIMTPPRIIDYVIVHELSHIREKNHSAEFWKEVEAVIPEHKKLKRWLQEHHHQFML